MKTISKSFLLIAFLGMAFMASAKVSFKLLKEHELAKASEICGDLCMGKCNADGNSENVEWDLMLDVAPNAPQADKDKIIANYQTCLEMGLPYILSHYESLKTCTIMIPRGLFITEKDGSYDEKMRYSVPKKEDKTNFENFVKIAEPIFAKHFESLKVLVWQKNPEKKK